MLHLVKLCVGATSIEDLSAWQAQLKKSRKGSGLPPVSHETRMMPKRVGELLDGGSLYWVIKGQVRVRQRLLDVAAITDREGRGACRLVLDEALYETRPKAMRPFQGWRYLDPAAAPADLGHGAHTLDATATMPDAMRRELVELGLL